MLTAYTSPPLRHLLQSSGSLRTRPGELLSKTISHGLPKLTRSRVPGHAYANSTLVTGYKGKKVELGQLKVGDHILGPDGKPREVVEPRPGVGLLHRVNIMALQKSASLPGFDCSAATSLSLVLVDRSYRNYKAVEYAGGTDEDIKARLNVVLGGGDHSAHRTVLCEVCRHGVFKTEKALVEHFRSHAPPKDKFDFTPFLSNPSYPLHESNIVSSVITIDGDFALPVPGLAQEPGYRCSGCIYVTRSLAKRHVHSSDNHRMVECLTQTWYGNQSRGGSPRGPNARLFAVASHVVTEPGPVTSADTLMREMGKVCRSVTYSDAATVQNRRPGLERCRWVTLVDGITTNTAHTVTSQPVPRYASPSRPKPPSKPRWPLLRRHSR